MILLALLITMHASEYQLREPISSLIKHIGVWLSFSFFGFPPINEVGQAFISGVAWTLPYEWFFLRYFAINSNNYAGCCKLALSNICDFFSNWLLLLESKFDIG
jgi:hypothetical protein